MTPSEPRPVDALIEDVRRRRREIAEEFGFDLRRLFDELKRLEAEHPEKRVDPRNPTVRA